MHERAKIFHALDLAATVIGNIIITIIIIIIIIIFSSFFSETESLKRIDSFHTKSCKSVPYYLTTCRFRGTEEQ
jgi:magnesium-transporting ATPase (P-type)